ncbi:TIGR03087 family PEP-CTERM/XrtA system glycosyltransferase [Azohydromonas caseinilytica]|uniref:TIGR03087 family PEP-CTERM/XrtA system glycosyltransferase n=1 Tax=Azohydromonas caseinilytica TaxID=2728836 RepID=A0A848F4S4_9BURK|nr:TIGR03087 family PEP-CTERM/XrtA system glycosyltransferase [Azohydromonas caseinilytica]NML14402.1 TIGR03087 family PEP-CTERM/XrtA system glycosyltransferase [Azohydromonas caseinilytica]
MANLLYLVHRLPYPPNKGDKVRSFHLLKHLAARHRVFLGTFVDDPEDEAYVDHLRPYCADMHVARLHARLAKLASLRALPRGQALTLSYYDNAGLRRWVRDLAAREALDAAVVFSSSMAQYVDALPQLPMLVDFVDVDSAKWTQYASAHRWPMSWLYAREGQRLLACERAVAARARRSFFVTEAEVGLFRQLAPECAHNVEPIGNGVDAEFFAPDPRRASPFGDEAHPLVFTGAMDYWPNVDAVCWFAREVLPRLLQRWPQLRLHIVGRSPTAAVQALAGAHVNVTGTVPDVRPYLQHAAVVVAPLRLARGVQNKILEAMAMARPVVASLTCTRAIEAQPGAELVPALEVEDYVQQIDSLLAQPERAAAIGQAGRQRVLRSYSWDAHLSGLDTYLVPSSPAVQTALCSA